MHNLGRHSQHAHYPGLRPWEMRISSQVYRLNFNSAGTLPAALPQSVVWFDASSNNITGMPTLIRTRHCSLAAPLTSPNAHRDPTGGVGSAGELVVRARSCLQPASWHPAPSMVISQLDHDGPGQQLSVRLACPLLCCWPLSCGLLERFAPCSKFTRLDVLRSSHRLWTCMHHCGRLRFTCGYCKLYTAHHS